MSDVKAMAHIMAGYPDYEQSLAIAGALVAGGADYLELQFPYSDPSADGPVIEKASHAALAAGFRVDDGFRMLKELGQLKTTPLFVMTYASLVFARGVQRFAEDAASAGASGLIIPDLPPDFDEGLFQAGKAAGVAVVPVLSPAISAERLAMIASLKPEYVYTALRVGVTGKQSVLDAATLAYLDKVAMTGGRIIAGFGVRTREQMLALSGKVYAAAVGSYFVETINAHPDDTLTALQNACAALKSDNAASKCRAG